MSDSALYIVCGLLLACCLLRVFFDRQSDNEFSNPLSRPADPPIGALLDPQLSAQLFGSEDWRYITTFRSRKIEGEFLKIRKKLALSWIRAAKTEAHALLGAHRAAARASVDLDFFVEFRVTLAYASFLFFCTLLDFVIRIRGPVGLQVLAKLTDSRSEQLFEIVGQFFPVALSKEDSFNGMSTGKRGYHP
ncbi:MAG: hypothetical protein JSS69_18095 [Acidobacteria bacterium]|nr:hypothetical protein [Acidobacteriota bacterium]